jgi:hypothetical protein
MSKKLTLRRIGLLGFTPLIVIGLVVYLGSKFHQYQQIGKGPIFNANAMSIAITTPGSGYQGLAGTPLSVKVLASGPNPISGVDLWVDNDKVGVMESPYPEGTSPFAVSFTGIVFNPGVHMLRARATDTQADVKNSEIVWIYIAEDPNQTTLIQQPSSPSINPPPSGEPVDQTGPWAPTAGGFIDWLFGSKEPLTAPDLVAQVEGCRVTLFIHDQSEDELGFSVFRTVEGQTQSTTPTFNLASHPGKGWFATEDVLTQDGTYTYLVEAFNGEDQTAASNPAVVTTDCPSQPSDSMTYSLILKKFTPPVAAENLYCYVSADGINWQRTPEVGFFPPEVLEPLDPNELGIKPPGIDEVEGGSDSYPADSFFDVFTELTTTGPGTSAGSQIIQMDCWAWLGGQLGSLGQYEFGVDTSQTGMIDLNKPEVGTEITFNMLPNNLLESIFPPKPELDPQLLSPTIHFSTADSVCLSHLPGWVKPDFELQRCHPGEYVDILNPGDLSWHQHMYVYWDLDNKQNCGQVGQCVDPSDQASLDQWGYIVSDAGYNLYDLSVSSIIPAKTFYSLNEVLYIVPEDGSCGDVRTFKIRSWIKLFGSDTVYESKGLGMVVNFIEPCWAIVLPAPTQEGQVVELPTVEGQVLEQPTLEIQVVEPPTQESP